MATAAAPTSRDLETLRKDLAAESRRVQTLIDDLNKTLQHAKSNDDRIEGMVKALAAKVVATAQTKRLDALVDKLNEVFDHAKTNDDRIETMVKALEAKVVALAKAKAKP